MKYFNDKQEARRVLEYVKKQYKDEHDQFHKFTLELLQANSIRDSFYAFLQKIVIMDIQSKPYKSSKYSMLKIFDELEKRFDSKIFQENFKKSLIDMNSKDPLDYFYKNILSIKGIGGKIANLVIKNFVYFGDVRKYFGVSKNKLLPLLRVPVDVHVANLLCHRLQISPLDLYDKIRNASTDKVFQSEVKAICEESSLSPADFDILWYVGYQNCNKRIYCSMCKIKSECKDQNFETETKKNIKDIKRANDEIKFVKNHTEIKF